MSCCSSNSDSRQNPRAVQLPFADEPICSLTSRKTASARRYADIGSDVQPVRRTRGITAPPWVSHWRARRRRESAPPEKQDERRRFHLADAPSAPAMKAPRHPAPTASAPGREPSPVPLCPGLCPALAGDHLRVYRARIVPRVCPVCPHLERPESRVSPSRGERPPDMRSNRPLHSPTATARSPVHDESACGYASPEILISPAALAHRKRRA